MAIVSAIVRLSSHALRKFVDAVWTVENFSHIMILYYTSLTPSMYYLFMYTSNKELILGFSLFFFCR